MFLTGVCFSEAFVYYRSQFYGWSSVKGVSVLEDLIEVLAFWWHGSSKGLSFCGRSFTFDVILDERNF